jgi:hypothetical protein
MFPSIAESADTQSKLRKAELEMKDKDAKLVSLVNRLTMLGVKLDESGNLVEDDDQALQSETAKLRGELEKAKADGLHRLGEAVKDKKKYVPGLPSAISLTALWRGADEQGSRQNSETSRVFYRPWKASMRRQKRKPTSLRRLSRPERLRWEPFEP